MARMFGTDGVRGVAGSELTIQLATKLGQAGAYVLTKEQSQLAERLQEAFDEFEYEKGLTLFDTEVCR